MMNQTKTFPMNNTIDITEDIIESHRIITEAGPSLCTIRPAYRAHWEKLFEYYNANHTKKFSTNCFPCFAKVYKFVSDQLKDGAAR